MKLRPLQDRVIVKQTEAEEKTASVRVHREGDQGALTLAGVAEKLARPQE